MKYTFLDGKNIESDAKIIEEKMENNGNMVFIYTHEKIPLFTYIENLKDKGNLSDEKQLKLKICYERKNLNLDLTLRDQAGRFLRSCIYVGTG